MERTEEVASTPTRDRAPPPRPPRPFRRQAIPVKSDRGLSDAVRIEICRYLLQGLQVKGIAKQVNCSDRAVYNVKKNLIKYGSVRAPPQSPLGAKQKISDEDADALFEALKTKGWMSQSAMREWLLAERGTTVSQSTVSRFLVDRGWTRRTLKPYLTNGQDGEIAAGQEDHTASRVPTGPESEAQSSANPSPTAPPAYTSPYPPIPSSISLSYMQPNNTQPLLPPSQHDDGSMMHGFGGFDLDDMN